MRWIRSIRRTGRTASVCLPNELREMLGLAVGGIIQVEWSVGQETVTLRPFPHFAAVPPIPPAEQAPSTFALRTRARRKYDNMETYSLPATK